MEAEFDHLVVAGRDLGALRDAFTAVGLEPEYGGEHGNGITHNYVVGFPDRTYVELISTIEPGETSPWWNTEIQRTSGAAAWAISVSEIERETERLADNGFAVEGPTTYSRDRPDGTRIEWDLTVVGDRMGIPLPFLIEDRTPRERRVPVTDSVRSTSMRGISDVLLGVNDLERWIDPFATLFECGSLERAEIDDLDATGVTFPGTPVTLLEPRGDGYLSDRVQQFENRPIGCVFSDDDIDGSASIDWFGDDLRWLSIDVPGRFGAVNRV